MGELKTLRKICMSHNDARGKAMLRIATVALAWLVLPDPAAAGFATTTLDTVAVTVPHDARVPMALTMTDASGAPRTLAVALNARPALLIFADYTCQTLCGPILAIAAAGLAKTGLDPGKDFRIVVVGLDPKDSAEDARRMKLGQVGDGALAAASTFLLADEGAVRQVTKAVGYHYAYDANTDQFAHPAVVFVLTPDGRVARTLSALGVDATDLRLALVEAGEGRLGGVADHLRLLCYGYDAATGIYTLTIRKWLALASLLTIIVVAGGIGLLLISRQPAASSCRSLNVPSEPA